MLCGLCLGLALTATRFTIDVKTSTFLPPPAHTHIASIANYRHTLWAGGMGYFRTDATSSIATDIC